MWVISKHMKILYFKYGGLIDKKFDVKKGGSISWEGTQ
jgi:hypothetical protein